MNIFIFGGSFDPVHRGHVALIQTILQKNIDRLLIVPTGGHPEKKRYLLSAEQRLLLLKIIMSKNLTNNEKTMAKLLNFVPQELDNKDLILDDPRIEICEDEIFHTDTCYTYHTIQQIHKRFPDARCNLLVGADQAANFGTWYQSRELAEMVNLWYVPRDGYRADEDFCWNLLEFSEYDISSTKIKEWLKKDRDLVIKSPDVLLAQLIFNMIDN